MNGYVIMLTILAFLLITLCIIIYSNHAEADERDDKTNSLRRLARANRLLDFVPQHSLINAYLIGNYRGYRLGYNTYQHGFCTRTRLTLSTGEPATSDNETLNPDDLIKQLSTELPYSLRGEIEFENSGKGIRYEQDGIEVDENYLQFLIHLLYNLNEGYRTTRRLGSKIAPALKAIATPENPLRPIIAQWLRDIGEDLGSYHQEFRFNDLQNRGFVR